MGACGPRDRTTLCNLCMPDQFIPKSQRTVPEGAGATVGGASARKIRFSRPWIALVIFLLALTLRAGHNVNLRHQVWMHNDAYNYLFTGNLILRAIQEPSRLQGLIRAKPCRTVPDHLKLASKDLSDRLSLDGLLYPAYLALAQAVAGVGHGITMEESRLPVCICNSIVDSLNCVLVFLAGSIAFGTGVGVVAGLLIAIYPPFIVNTQQCLSEPLASFCISLWLLAMFRAIKLTGTSWRFNAVTAIFVGVSTAFVIMIKPTHVVLPVIVTVLLAVFWAYKRFNRSARNEVFASSIQPLGPRRAASFGMLALFSAALILLPATSISKAITGDWLMSAKRSPFESLALTFNASQDGWRAYPYPGDFPTNSRDMVQMAKQALLDNNAGELFLIGIKKVSRLWSGVANDYQYSVLSLGYGSQVLLHRLLLVFAFVGTVILLARTKTIWDSRRVLCGFVLLSTMMFHSIYLVFEAMPRYFTTAVPAVIILAAYGLVGAYRSALAPAHFLAPVALATGFLFLVQTSKEQCSFIAGALGEQFVWLAPSLTAAVQSFWVLGILGFCVSLLIVGPVTQRKTVMCSEAKSWISPSIKLVYAVVISVVMLVTIVSVLDKRDWTEWRCDLREGQIIKQKIPLPLTVGNQNAVLLLDCESSLLPPPISARVNGKDIVEKPVPFAQMTGNVSSIVDGLMQTEFVMNKDSRAFRQWWAIPIAAGCLKPGFDNEITVTSSSNVGATIFGDYKCDDKEDLLPSFWRFSYTKGYCSIERGDPRIMESAPSSNSARNAIKPAFFDAGHWANDLSNAWGSQTGRYRIRILGGVGAWSKTESYPTLRPLTLLSEHSVCEVVGSNPASMFPKIVEPQKLPSCLPADTRFEFSCEVRTISSSSESVISLIFGDNPGWSSPWQPRAVPITREWTRVLFSDVLPRNVVPGAKLKLVVYPYQPDLIYTNRKEAIAAKVEIRNAIVTLLPPISLAPPRMSSAILY